jgi:6-pyruvoyltetrahydropterin/6-carboxytetrahydropterin synthase
MLTCQKRYSDIPFAHRQPNHDGHCRLVHGHNWSVEFEFTATERDENGFVIDFGKLKAVRATLDALDHAIVLDADDPELAYFQARPDLYRVVTVQGASAEGLAAHFLARAQDAVDRTDDAVGRGVRVVRCTVYEDSKNAATARAA